MIIKTLIILLLLSLLTHTQGFNDKDMIIDPPFLDDQCPFGHYFHPKGCLQCLSTCTYCQTIQFYGKQCPYCGDAFKINEDTNTCIPCEDKQLYCDYFDIQEFDESQEFTSSYFVEDGRVWIMEEDVISPCDWCTISSQSCDNKKIQPNLGSPKCGEPQDMYFQSLSQRNFIMKSFFKAYANNYVIKQSNFEQNICVFDCSLQETQITYCNFSTNVSFYSSNFQESRIKSSNFRDKVYFKNSSLAEVYLSDNTFENMVVFHKTSFNKTEIKNCLFTKKVQFHNIKFTNNMIVNTTFSNEVLFDNCDFKDITFKNVSFTSKVIFSQCSFMRATWIRMTFSDVTFNYSNLNIVEIEESNFTNVIIDKSNLNKIYLNTSSKTEIIIQNSFTLYMSCDDCSNISFSNNASVAVMRNPHSLPVKQKLPFDQQYHTYKCQSCSQRCSICMNTPTQCLECAPGYMKQGWKCIKENHILFELFLSGKSLAASELSNAVEMIRKTFLAVNDNYKGKQNKEAITLRQFYEISSGQYSIIGMMEQVNEQDMQELKKLLLDIKQVDHRKVDKLQFGKITQHPRLPLFLILGIIFSVLLLAGLVVCCCRFRLFQKLKSKFVKKQITYEMYGQFKDESSSAK